MEAWVLYFFYQIRHPIDFQNEDACVIAAKVISETYPVVCINTFDGRVLWFSRGKQVDKP